MPLSELTTSSPNALALRLDELAAWLEPLADVLGQPITLCSLDGAVLKGGPLGPATPREPIWAQGTVVALVACEGPVEAVRALARTVAGFLEQRLTIAEMAQSLSRAWMESNFLYGLADSLQGDMDIPSAARTVARQLLRVQRASRVALYLVGAAGPEACEPPGPASPEEGALAARAIAAGEPLASEADGAMLAVPLVERGRTLGALVVSGGSATPNLKFLASVSTRIAQALETRVLVQAAIRSAEVQHELALAAEIHAELLPTAMPAGAGLRLAGRCLPAGAVGGDGYTFFPREDGLDLAVVDASGHGLGPAIVLGHCFSFLAAIADDRHPPAEVAGRLNRHLERAFGRQGHYVTGVYMRWELPTRRLTWVSMGHPAALLLRGGRARPLEGGRGLPAGLVPEATYEVGEAALAAGDVVVVLTDGLLEARNAAGEQFGLARAAAVAEASMAAGPDAIVAALFEACEGFAEGRARADDQTAIVLEVEAGP